MAKRTQRVAPEAAAGSADGNAGGAAQSDAVQNDAGHTANFVTFDLADGKFGFHLGDVGEIIRVPNLARMPLAPQSLVGLANMHGVVLPVVDLRRLLGLPGVPLGEATRVIVIARGAPVGYVVDRIDGLVALPAGRLEKDDAGAGTIDPALLDGIIKGAEGESTVKILNPTRILRDEFSKLGVSGQRASSTAAGSPAGAAKSTAAVEHKVSLVSFELGGQEYALPLDRVQEIIQLPDRISEVARSETAVLGVVTLRDRLLPLVSLRALLGLPADSGREEPGKVVVLPMGGGAVGVVADRTREIIHVDPAAIDTAPSLLTRGEGDAEITSICRLDQENAWSPCSRRIVCSGPIWCAASCPSRDRRAMPRQAGRKEMQWPTSNSLSSGSAIRTTDCRSRRSTRSPGRRSASPACPRLRPSSTA